MQKQPILKLKNGEAVKTMFYDGSTGVVLVGTSLGRILMVKNIGANAYAAGNRTVYVSTSNGLGEESSPATSNVQYELIDRVLELTSGFEVVNLKEYPQPFGAEKIETVSGIFTTPVLWSGEDFGWWGDLGWTQFIPSGCRVVVAARMASSGNALSSSPWTSMEFETSGNKSWSMDGMSSNGGYAQIKIIMTSTSTASPSVSDLVLPYKTAHASYFFVTKLAMDKGTPIKGGLLTSSVTVPVNTVVKTGVVNSNTSDWTKYTEVEGGKLFELPDDFGHRIKVGVKFISYDDVHYPVMDEFSVAFDADTDNLINHV